MMEKGKFTKNVMSIQTCITFFLLWNSKVDAESLSCCPPCNESKVGLGILTYTIYQKKAHNTVSIITEAILYKVYK